jgi:hypothetical protein
VRWERTRTSRGGDNSAPQYKDRISLRCGGPTARELLLLEEEGPHSSPSTAIVGIPEGPGGGPAVVITTTFDAGDEGEFGTSVEGRVVDLATCRSVK